MATRKYIKYTRLKSLSFKRATGVNKDTYKKMCVIIKKQREMARGPSSKLSVQDQVIMSLKYWREYVTYSSLGIEFGVSESTAYKTVKYVEDALIASEEFTLPGKKLLIEESLDEVLAIDATETPIQRPKTPQKKGKKIKNRRNKQKKYYSGKKKMHTLKTQAIVGIKSKKIFCIFGTNGKTHDFKLFKDSRSPIHPKSQLLADSGYEGISKLHELSTIPKKARKNKPLTREDRKFNKELSSIRIIVENIFAKLKRFKIISEKYRNRKKRFWLRFNLIVAIYNMELN